MALEAFRRIQIGAEATRGTAVAADKKLVGALTMNPTLTFHRPVDERNSLAEFRRSVIIAQRGVMRYESDGVYEQIHHFLSMAVKGGITPTTPGGGTLSRDWTFVPNLTASNVQDSYTWEYGDDSQAWEGKFTLCNNLEFTIALDDVMTMRADLFSHFPTKTTFTGSLSDAVVNEIIGNNVKIFIDGTFANLGTTQKAALMMGATVRLATGLTPVRRADGLLEFADVSQQRRHLELELDLVMGTDAVTEYDAWAAETARAIRIEFLGPIIEGAINYKLRIDAFGFYMNEPTLFDGRDGENLIRLNLASHEDDVANNEFSIEVTNKETAI